MSMKAIVDGRLVLPGEVLENRALLYDGKILGIVAPGEIPAGAERLDAQGRMVLPGLMDLHIHGYQGEDASDGSFEGLKVMAQGVAKNGVTAFLPTTMTVSYDDLRRAFAQIRRAMAESRKDDWMGAAIVGANAEGPFINAARKGAQAEEHVRPGDAAFLKEYADVIRLFTIAPEVDGNMDCIREMAKQPGVRISMGHTAATYDQAKAAIDAGVRHVTHLFNAQTGLHQRDPGVVGAALTDGRVTCELIADTFHVHRALFELVAKMKGENLALITDCLRATGLEDGTYTLGGQEFTLQGIQCHLKDGTIAGSVLKLNHAIKNMLDNTDLTIPEAVKMASLTPARCIGLDGCKGSIEVGKDADLALADDRFEISTTILGGRTIYDRR